MISSSALGKGTGPCFRIASSVEIGPFGRKMDQSPAVVADRLPGAVVWEETCCLLCRKSRTSPVEDIPELVYDGVRAAVVRCRRCGLLYTNPRPSAETIQRFYEDYEPHQSCGLSPRDAARVPRRFQRPHFWTPYHPRKHGMPLAGQGRLLDFGCGGGAFLERMHRQGWQVAGIDTCRQMVEAIRTKLHLRAVAGTLPHAELSPQSFDVVSMWHSLEHVHQPLETLRHAWQLLAPGGELVLGVPNAWSAARRWYGGAWCGWRLPHHLTHFTPDTLREMVRRAGFQIRRLMLPGNSCGLRESAATVCRQGRPRGWRRWLTNGFVSRRVATCLAWTRQSDEMVLIAKKPLVYL